MFNDRQVREAITLAFDFEWMNKALFYGAYSRASSYFQNTEYAARHAPDAEELALLTPMKADLPPEVFTSVYQPPRSRGDGFDRTNLLQADALLKQAGWVLKNQRRINTVTSKPLRFELLLPSGATIAGCCRSSIISSASVLRWIFAVSIIHSTVTADAVVTTI